MGRKLKDLTNKTFGKWLVKRRGADRRDNRGTVVPYWLCVCLGCKRTKEVAGYSLRQGGSLQCKSCCKRRYTDEQKVEAARMDAQGVTYTDIGKMLGCDRGYARVLALQGAAVSNGKLTNAQGHSPAD